MKISIKNRGVVLVAVLWIVMLMTVIAVTASRTCRLGTKVSLASVDAVQCKWAARAGVETAVAVFNENLRTKSSLSELLNSSAQDLNNVPVGNFIVTVKVIDEAAKLNVNVVTKEQLMGLQNNLTEDVADSIIDWRDSDNEPNGSGVEGGYYENMPFRYKIRNGPFKTIRELSLVKGVTEDLLFGIPSNSNIINGERSRTSRTIADYDDSGDGWIQKLTCYSYDKNFDADGNARININEVNETALVQSLGITQQQAAGIVRNRPNNGFTSIADLLTQSSSRQSSGSGSGRTGSSSQSSQPLDLSTFTTIADKITVTDQNVITGRININTASKPVLTALFGGDANDKAIQLADNLITYRDSLSDGFSNIGQVMNVTSMDTATFKKVANNLTVRSDVFSIRSLARSSRGEANGPKASIEAVVDRSSSPCRIIYWYQTETN